MTAAAAHPIDITDTTKERDMEQATTRQRTEDHHESPRTARHRSARAGRRHCFTSADALTDLVTRAAAGDDAAFTALVTRFDGLVQAIARRHRLSSHDTADMAQATWMQLFRFLGQIREPDALPGWVATTARREALRVLRARDLHVVAADPTEYRKSAPGAPSADLPVLDAERREEVRRALGTLSPRCQRLLDLLIVDKTTSYQDVAATLSIAVGSVGPLRQRCLECLQRRAAILGMTTAGKER